MRSLRALALYLLMTVALTWPLPALLRVVDAGDSAFFAWAVGWGVEALTSQPSRLPHGPIFHPLRYTLGMDEPVLGTTLLVLPLAPFTADGVLLFNLARLLTFPLSALTAYWLARELRCSEGPALLAGALFAFSPIRTDQLAHLSTLGTQWLPLVLLFLHRCAHNGRAADSALAGLFFALSALACGYHGLIGLAVLPPAALVLMWGRWPRWPALVAGPAVAAVGLLPLYLLHRAALEPLGYVRGPEETVFYSAALETFLATSARNRVWGEITAVFRTTRANDLFPGLVIPVLIAAAAWRTWRRGQRPSRDTLALAVVALAAAVVALGPELRLFGRTLAPAPFAALRELVPLFQSIRVTSRSGAFIALPLAVLAGRALMAMPSLRGRRLLPLAALAIAETVIAPIEVPGWTQVVDTRRPPPPVYAWLASQPAGTPVVELPMLDISGVFERPAFHESVYMVRALGHGQPLANGYAGIEPPDYVRLRDLARHFPAPAFLDELRRRGVRYVLLHGGGYGPNRWARLERELGAAGGTLVEVARFGGDRVYELR